MPSCAGRAASTGSGSPRGSRSAGESLAPPDDHQHEQHAGHDEVPEPVQKCRRALEGLRPQEVEALADLDPPESPWRRPTTTSTSSTPGMMKFPSPYRNAVVRWKGCVHRKWKPSRI